MQLFSVIKEAIEAKLCLVLMLLILGTLTVQGAIPARMLWLNTRQGGQGLEWTKCPAVRKFYRISTEGFFQTS